MKIIYRLHWDGWTRDIEPHTNAPQNYAPGTYQLHLHEPPTGLVAGDLRMLVSPPAWAFSIRDHETVKAEGMEETVIVHYIADEPPWTVWVRYHETKARLVPLADLERETDAAQ